MRSYYLRNAASAAAGVALASLLSIFIIYAARPFLNNVVGPPPDVLIEDWLDRYASAELKVCLWSALMIIAWHALSLWSSGRSHDLRSWWRALYLGSVVGTAGLAIATAPSAQVGQQWALAVALVIGVAAYWLGTVWCTAPSNKYAPWGSHILRRG